MKKMLGKITWDWAVIMIFLAIRLVINFENNVLSMFFAVVYAVFILMLLFGTPLFASPLVLFLTLDSIIGTYLFANNALPEIMYYGTMLVNFAIIVILIQNFNNRFKK